MSIALVKQALESFLATEMPEVLCIEGRWGTGKTYAWKEAVRAALAGQRLAIKKYAYVSLFGLKDSNDIIQAVFANTEDLASVRDQTKLPGPLGRFTVGDLKAKLKSFGSFATEHANVPYVAGLGGVTRALLATFVSKTLICIDDFERKSSGMSVNEIMGTIAQLRDARECKVVLILNENSLTQDEQNEFHRFSEKVINRAFQFNPTSAKAARIAFPNDDNFSKDLRSICEALGIVNIRVMARLESYVRQLRETLAGFDPEVIANVTRALSVIVWVALSPEGEGAPTLTFLLDTREKQFLGVEEITTTDEEDQWGKILTNFGFGYCDEVDRLLIEDVKNGFFNEVRLQNAIQTYSTNVATTRAREALTAAWKPFHASFANNEKQVADSIYQGHLDNILHVTPNNLSSAVTVLKDIGFPEKASVLLDRFMSPRGAEDIFDRKDDVFGTEIRDPDVINAFDQKLETKQSTLPSPQDAAAKLYKGGWSQRDEMALQQLTIDDFVRLFEGEEARGDSNFISGCLVFRKIANATPEQKAIAEKAEAALIKLGQRSALNAHRLRRYQINILRNDNVRER